MTTARTELLVDNYVCKSRVSICLVSFCLAKLPRVDVLVFVFFSIQIGFQRRGILIKLCQFGVKSEFVGA